MHSRSIEAVVADIEDEALLGYDVLEGGSQGADILLSQNKIILDGIEIPCFQVGRSHTIKRVVMADDAHIPGRTEALVDVYVERNEGDDHDQNGKYIIEPTEQFVGRYHILMASVLVDINASTTCKVRVLNPFAHTVTLRQDAEVGRAEKIELVLNTIAERENPNELVNFNRTRRVSTVNRQENTRRLPFKAAIESEVPGHLKELFDKSTQGRSEVEKQAVAGLFVKYSDTFSKDEWDIGLTHLTEHSIDTGDAKPIRQRPRRVPLAFAKEERQAIDDLMKKGVIKESTSPWASPIVLVRKKSGAVRPCVDYRKVNGLIKQDGFPLPRIQDCLDAVSGSSLFSSFDLTSGYFQIPLKPEDIPKSAFVSKYGQYEMTRMPFGLSNSASTFQRTMELALQGLQWITCLVYIDDIIVFAPDFEQHLCNVDEVLGRIRDAGLKLKPEKCQLLQTEVIFLGHVVSGKGVSPDPTNIAKIVQWQRPQNAKEVKQFFATGSYYRRFVKDYAKIVRPLTDLTKKKVYSSGMQLARRLLIR
jgi:hypothetical protein